MCRNENDGISVPFTVQPEQGQGYVVTSSVLPELTARGITVEDALHQAQVQLSAILDQYENGGKPLPEIFR